MQEQEYIKQLKKLLINSLKKLTKSERLAIAFSGGVDSSILAKLLKEFQIKPIAYVVGIENCKDFDSAEKVTKELGLELKKIILTKQEIERSLPIQVKILQKLYEKYKDKHESKSPSLKSNPVSVSFNLPLFFVAKYSKEKNIISGQGADTMLGGFAKHLQLTKKQSIEKIKKDTKELTEIGYLQHKKTAEYFNKEVLMPYLDKNIANFCLNLPYELKIKDEERKYILRKLAKNIGLSDETSFREKKAAQYGTGIMKTMKKIAKQNNMTISDYIKNII